LIAAIDEIKKGLIDADLGGGMYKKRIPIQGKGKSAGFRTLLAYKSGKNIFFLYGFSKNKQSNISKQELRALKLLAKQFLSYDNQALDDLIVKGILFEVIKNE
jgi:hypothetical protein